MNSSPRSSLTNTGTDMFMRAYIFSSIDCHGLSYLSSVLGQCAVVHSVQDHVRVGGRDLDLVYCFLI